MDVKRHIRAYIADNLLFTEEGIEYDDDTSFLEKGLIDSMGVMELVMYVGTGFGIHVDPRDVTPENFDSVNRLAAYIGRKQEQPDEATASAR